MIHSIKSAFLPAVFFLLLLSACNRPKAHVTEYYLYSDDSAHTSLIDKKIPKTVLYFKNDDSLNSREVQYYEDGSKKMEGHYVNDLREGEWTAWYRDGNIWSQGTYIEGQAEGTRNVYYPNGQIYITGDYKKGVRVGEWTFYDSTGVILKQINY